MKKITSEEPSIHWPFLNVKNKKVLDLGCGQFYSSVSTAEWFLNKGADKVIGVDLSDISLFNDNFTMIGMRINSSDQLKSLIDTYLPDVIKCDIEGAEEYFNEISLSSSVKQFAVEYHDNNTKLICERAIEDWGFENVETYQLFNEDINRIGVIHAWKNS